MKKLPILYRTFPAADVLVETRAAGEDKASSYTFSISSEAPVERWFGKEILSHEDGAIDKRYMRGGLSVLADSHWGQQVGILENARVEDKKLRGEARFSKGVYGQEVEQDVKDKIRKYVSVGYRVLKAKLIETKDGVDTWLVTRWMPIHMAILADPADVSVGLGRAEGQQEYEVEIEDGDPVQEERTMPNDGPVTATPTGRSADAPAPAPAPAAPASPAAPVVETQSQRNYSKEAAEIFRMAAKHGMSERAAEWVEKGLTPQEVGMLILDEIRTEGSGQPPAEELPGKEKDLRNYSYSRAIRLGLVLRGERGLGEFDGLEAEVHQELLRKAPNGHTERGGILIPMRTRKPDGRALDTKTPGAGAELVQDGPAELIDMLRTRALVMRFGATVLPGLTRPIPFPKQTSGMTMHWVGENPGSDVADSTPGTGLAILGPKNLMGQGKFSRQLMIEGSVDAEQMIRREIVNADSRAFDKAAIHGTGTGGEPQGIYYAADVNVKAMGGVPDFGKIVDMEGQVADKDADMGALAHMTTPLMAAKMMQTLVASAAGSAMIWTGDFQEGRVAGYRAGATNQIEKTLGAGTEHGWVYGNWADLVIGFWDALELLLDPYTLAGQAMLRIVAFHMGDVLIRHGQSFTKATGATVS